MSFWRGKSGQVPPAALALLAGFVALPFLLYFIPPNWWRGDFRDPDAPVTRLQWQPQEGEPATGPTVGMSLGEDGFGTVLDAPALSVTRTSQRGGFVPDEPIAADVARFIRAIPREVVIEPSRERITTCTLEGPPSYSGKVVLVDGCPRFQDAGSKTPGPLVLGITHIHRDAQGYLALGLLDASPEFEIRFGEPDGIFSGVGCSKDEPVPAPPALAKACKVDTMRRIAVMKRKPLCSKDDIARLAAARTDNEAQQARLRATHESCLATGKPAQQCPPPAAPSPYDIYHPDCILPGE